MTFERLRFYIPFFVLIICFSSAGQGEAARKKIEAARIALITERLELTPEQAEKFWPIYREYGERRREIRREFDVSRRQFDPDRATDEENRRMLKMANQVKEQQLKLEREYSDRMMKFINARQINNLRKAESDFNEMLLKRLREERNNRRQQFNNNDSRLRNRKN
ncbi:MAG: hypothetical protein AAF789_02770 [Bacteroidota bacterium]